MMSTVFSEVYKMEQLTDRQKEILIFLVEASLENLFQPSQQEIGEVFKISREAVRGHLTAIESKGWITITPEQNRAIELTDEAINLVKER